MHDPLEDLPHQPPTWLVPIAAGAITAFLLHGVALVEPALWCCFATTCGAAGIPAGFIAAYLAARRDPQVRAGQGFIVAFLGAGTGSLLAGLASGTNWQVPEGFEDTILQEWRNDPPSGMSAEDQAEVVEWAVWIASLTPFFAVAAAILLAGLTGMLTAGLVNRTPRYPIPPAPPPPPA